MKNELLEYYAELKADLGKKTKKELISIIIEFHKFIGNTTSELEDLWNKHDKTLLKLELKIHSSEEK